MGSPSFPPKIRIWRLILFGGKVCHNDINFRQRQQAYLTTQPEYLHKEDHISTKRPLLFFTQISDFSPPPPQFKILSQGRNSYEDMNSLRQVSFWVFNNKQQQDHDVEILLSCMNHDAKQYTIEIISSRQNRRNNIKEIMIDVVVIGNTPSSMPLMLMNR